MDEKPGSRESSASERLARSRAELHKLFEPTPHADGASNGAEARSKFPRSMIMKAITKNGGKTGLTLAVVALLAARPALAAKLLRYIPVSAITKIVVARFIDSQGTKK